MKNSLKCDKNLSNSNDLIFIPYNVPSLKNSKVKTSRGIFSSATVNKYLRLLGIQRYSASKKIVVGYKTRKNVFEEIRENFEKQKEGAEQPYLIAFHFVRHSKRDFDFNNATQIVQDLLVAHDMLEDDCCRVMIPVPLNIDGKWYSIDKTNPGVYIKIIK